MAAAKWGRIVDWDVSEWSMCGWLLFHGAEAFDQDIGGLEVGAAKKDTSFMCFNAAAFDQDISDWEA